MNADAKVAVIGYGVEGQSIVLYLLKHGYKNVTVCDENKDALFGLRGRVDGGVSVRTGASYLKGISDFDLIFRSPGVHLDKLSGVPSEKITSATRFFFEKCPCPIVGVSGTKGKGTCASLIFLLLSRPGVKKQQVRKNVSGREKIFLGGNIGVPALDFLDKLTKKSTIVLELSSFQLQDTGKSPHIAVLLNTTSDHMDYHADTFEYMNAKANILKHQKKTDFAVMNCDYDYFDYYAPLVRGKLLQVSRKTRISDGAYEEGGKIYFAHDGKPEFIMNSREIGIIGGHNVENVLPAVCVGKILGVKNEQIVKAAKEFKGLPHRLEFVRELRGVRYYNDSCSTNPETSIAGVYAFTEPLILIAGGSSKGADFDKWGKKLCERSNLKTVILIGQTAPELSDALTKHCGDKHLRIIRRGDLEETVLEAYTSAKPGSVVLLSPACASFDMFKNYKERGEMFGNIVWSLK